MEFDPSVGGEIQKKRPAVIVSNNASNQHLNRVQVVPLSSSTRKLYPSEAYVSVRKVFGKAMADQLTTASKTRLGAKVGVVSKEEMGLIEAAIKSQLDLR